jgi:DNA-binding CsgD family transcriptional regulator/PAS domain-containing protein
MPVAEAFYEAAIIPELWGKALDLASSAWGADGVVLSTYPDCLGGLISSDGLQEFCVRFVDEGWHKRDVRAARGVPYVRKGKEIVTDLDVFSEDELKQLPFYADFLQSLGLRWFAGSILNEAGGVFVNMSLQRRRGTDHFSEEDLAPFRRDLRDVKRAARLTARSSLAYAEGLVDSLERFDCGAVLLDRVGRVIQVNKKAETYLGEHLQVVSSRLRSPHREANRALQELVTASTLPVLESKALNPTSALLHRPTDLPLVVHSYPIIRQASDIFQGARALLLISNPGERRPLALKVLQEVFQLTPAELRIAAGLLRGLDTQQIAEEHKIGQQTVRYHLKAIFAKTDTSHQAQLVSLLAQFIDHR